MGTLARHTAVPKALRMEGWLYHLLCFAADAAANSQWQLASAALTSFAACLLRGCELPVSRQRGRAAMSCWLCMSGHQG